MTREETIERIKVMQAYINGEKVQYKKNSGKWADIEEPIWNNLIKYRIKPESKYRPFKDRQECWQEMQKHKPFGWIADIDSCRYILAVGEGSVVFKSFNSSDFCKSFDEVMDTYTFADGTPFGVKEEE